MKWWLLSIILPLVVLAVRRDPDKRAYCVSLAKAGDCNFYDKCVEKWTRTCGGSGYALGYGGKYCRKFADNLQLFNKAVCLKFLTPNKDFWYPSLKIPFHFYVRL